MIRPDQGYITYGSMAGLKSPSQAVFLHVWGSTGEPCGHTGVWNLEFAVQRGYLMLSWLPGSSTLPVMPTAARRRDTGIKKRWRFQPDRTAWWLRHTGCRPHCPGRRSVIIGLDDHHSRAHLYRAILEGTAYPCARE